MPSPGSGRVVGLGKATVDVLGVAPRSRDSAVELSQFSLQGGGPVATALATVASLGGSASFFGRVSDDEFGQFILNGLRDFGVDVSMAVREAGRVSPVSIVSIEEGSRRRTVQYTNGNTTPLLATDLPATILDGTRLICIDGYVPAAQAELAERAGAKEIPIILDAGDLWPGMGELLALADIVIASERLATEIAPSGEIEDSLMELAKMGPRIVVVTLGEDGAVGLEGDKLVRQKCIDVNVLDRTGAGDVFHGAFAYGVLQGWTLERCMPFATAAAGLKCRSLGGRGGIPSLAEVLRAAGL